MFGRHHRAIGAQGCGPATENFRDHRFDPFGRHHMRDMMKRRPKYNVPLNITDSETSFEVHVYAVGFAKENIKLTVTDDILYITGTRTIAEDAEPNFSRQEFPVKSFERVLNLNGQVATENISAKQEDGILIITLPKTEDARKPAQEIKVE
jgi:HSP20 family protein